MAASPCVNPPGKANESGAESRFIGWLNRLRDFAISNTVRDSKDIVASYASDGIRLFLRNQPAPSNGIGGLADPIVYDKTKSYKRGEMVLILPTDEIVVTGAYDVGADAVKKAIAGWWIATQPVSPETYEHGEETTAYHVPQWPWPVIASPGDSLPDDGVVFWLWISAYPTTVIDCNAATGAPVTTWTNAQPKT